MTTHASIWWRTPEADDGTGSEATRRWNKPNKVFWYHTIILTLQQQVCIKCIYFLTSNGRDLSRKALLSKVEGWISESKDLWRHLVTALTASAWRQQRHRLLVTSVAWGESLESGEFRVWNEFLRQEWNDACFHRRPAVAARSEDIKILRFWLEVPVQKKDYGRILIKRIFQSVQS